MNIIVSILHISRYNLNVIIIYRHYYKSNLFGGLTLHLGLWLIFMF